MVGTLSVMFVGLAFQLQLGGQVPNTKCITLLARGGPQAKGEFRPEAAVELRVKVAPNGTIIGRNLKPFISDGECEEVYCLQLPGYPLINFRQRQVTNWTGKVAEAKCSEGETKIPVDPKGFSTRERVSDGMRIREVIYEGEELKTKYIEAVVSFESQVTRKTIYEIRVGSVLVFTYSSTSGRSATFHLRVRHSTTTEWVYFDMLGNPDDDRLSRWHNPVRDGCTVKAKASWGWIEELVMTWQK